MERRSELARAEGVLSRQVGDDFVVIHPVTQAAHSLTGPAARVWAALEDDDRSFPDDAAAVDAVAQLSALGLLRSPGVSRRSMLKRTGIVAGAVGVTTIALPEAVAAASAEHLDVDYITGATSNFSESVGYVFGSTNYAWAQSFRVGSAGNLTRVVIDLFKFGGTDPLLVQIRNSVAGRPASTPLVAATVQQAQIPYVGAGSELISTKIGPLPVVAGQELFLSLAITAPTHTSDAWRINTSNETFTGWASLDGGTTWEMVGPGQFGRFEMQTYLTY